MKDKILLDLPVLLHDRDSACAEEKIHEAYLGELNKVSSPTELKEFCTRWQNVWLLKDPKKDEPLSPEERKIVDASFDAAAVLEWLGKKDSDGLPCEEDENVRVMMNIACPIALLNATMMANHFGVGSDLAMVRLYLDPYPEYDEACRYGSGDPRIEMTEGIVDG